ncbi:MAG: transglycosylase SLT domain-containing protein, partial [Acidimicrobiales bacterium]
PEPDPAPVQAAASGSVGDVIARHFGAAAGTATRIARCESGLNPGAVSAGGGNHGLFQINNVHRGTFESVTGASWSAVYDAEANTVFAKWLYDQEGWGPWACA